MNDDLYGDSEMDAPGNTNCWECGCEINDNDDEAPYCIKCWKRLEAEGFFELIG